MVAGYLVVVGGVWYASFLPVPRGERVNRVKNMKSLRTIEKLFYDEEFIGSVLRRSTALEFELGQVICQYFCQKRRATIALEKVIECMSWNTKIRLLTELPIRKTTKSYGLAVSNLRSFKRIRNLVAHQWCLSSKEVEKLYKNQHIARILDGYPETMSQSFRECTTALYRLRRTKEFLFEDKTYLTAGDLIFYKA